MAVFPSHINSAAKCTGNGWCSNLIAGLPTARLFVLSAMAAMPLLAMGESVDAPSADSYVLGERWDWQQVSNLTHLLEKRSFLAVVNFAGSQKFFNGAEYFPLSSDYSAIRGYKPSSSPMFSWPLQVGKKWKFDADWVRADGVTGHTQQDAEVVAYEEVAVPAGKFMAFKIEFQGFYRVATGGSGGKQTDTLWYSPQAKNVVKSTRVENRDSYTVELLHHDPGSAQAEGSGAVVASAASEAQQTGGDLLTRAELEERFIGKSIQMRRYVDGLQLKYSFNPDGTLLMEHDSRKSRSQAGRWEFSSDKLCLSVADKAPCYVFFIQQGIIKAGLHPGDARWEVAPMR